MSRVDDGPSEQIAQKATAEKLTQSQEPHELRINGFLQGPILVGMIRDLSFAIFGTREVTVV